MYTCRIHNVAAAHEWLLQANRILPRFKNVCIVSHYMKATRLLKTIHSLLYSYMYTQSPKQPSDNPANNVEGGKQTITQFTDSASESVKQYKAMKQTRNHMVMTKLFSCYSKCVAGKNNMHDTRVRIQLVQFRSIQCLLFGKRERMWRWNRNCSISFR